MLLLRFFRPATILVLVVSLLVAGTAGAAPKDERGPIKAPTPTRAPATVFAHYYPWHSAPPRTPNFRHWDAAGHAPPLDIAAPHFPVLGAYDGLDQRVLSWHMSWLTLAKVDVLTMSWWGRGSYEDGGSRAVLDAAAAAGLKVAFTIEPYVGRTPSTTSADIAYIYRQYGNHSGFYRVSRPTRYGPSTARRGVFFVYQVDGSQPWAAALDALRGGPTDAIVLMRMDDEATLSEAGGREQLQWTHADGLFNYGVYDNTSAYNRALPRPEDYILALAAAPGFDDARIGGSSRVSRQEGAQYDASWTELARQKPEWVSIVSFNEWHEGTQIEPALAGFAADGYTYQDYEGHYGLSDIEGSTAYLSRTAYWVDRYRAP